MALSAFDDKSHEPLANEVEEVLGAAATAWDRLVSEIESLFGPIDRDWVFSGKPWGWALRLRHKKRAVLYMTPRQGAFYVGFALGGKAVAAARRAGLPDKILRIIDEARDYAEGKAVRVEIRSEAEVPGMIEIAKAKMAN